MKLELIIKDSTFYLSKSILKFKYFERAYEYDKKLIFPDLLYEQICCYIENRYTEEHMKLLIFMVLLSLQKKEPLTKHYYYINSYFEHIQIKILIFLYIGEDIIHIIDYNQGWDKYKIGINNFLYELDELYNTKQLITSKQYIYKCCDDNIDSVYSQKVYYDTNDQYRYAYYFRHISNDYFIVNYTDNYSNEKNKKNKDEKFYFLYFTFCRFCRKVRILKRPIFMLEYRLPIPFKRINDITIIVETISIDFTEKETIILPPVKIQKEDEIEYIYSVFL